MCLSCDCLHTHLCRTAVFSVSAAAKTGAKKSAGLYDGGFHFAAILHMKAATDLIAVILFFLTYILTKNIIWATAVAIAAGIVQAAFLWWKFRRLETMQWLSLLLIVIFGGATILTGDRIFIMWKPTLLFWCGAAAMAAAALMKKNGLRALLGKEIELPDAVWKKLTAAWIAFLATMGAINLAVAYPFTAEREAVWNNYKFFGSTTLMFLFFLAQGIYLSRHLTQEQKND